MKFFSPVTTAPIVPPRKTSTEVIAQICDGIKRDVITSFYDRLPESLSDFALDHLIPPLTLEDIILITAAIRKNTSLIKLRLGDLSNDKFPHVAEALWQNQSITELELQVNKPTVQTLETIAALLVAKKNFTELDLSGTPIGPHVHLILKALKNSNSLRSLNLSNCNLTDQEVQELVEGLKHLPALTELDLSGNSLGDEAGRVLINCLKKHNPQLKTLNLSNCKIGKRTIQSLGGILKFNCLEELNVSKNKLTPWDIKSFSKSCKKNTSLLELDVSETEIYWSNLKNIPLATHLLGRASHTPIRLRITGESESYPKWERPIYIVKFQANSSSVVFFKHFVETSKFDFSPLCASVGTNLFENNVLIITPSASTEVISQITENNYTTTLILGINQNLLSPDTIAVLSDQLPKFNHLKAFSLIIENFKDNNAILFDILKKVSTVKELRISCTGVVTAKEIAALCSALEPFSFLSTFSLTLKIPTSYVDYLTVAQLQSLLQLVTNNPNITNLELYPSYSIQSDIASWSEETRNMLQTTYHYYWLIQQQVRKNYYAKNPFPTSETVELCQTHILPNKIKNIDFSGKKPPADIEEVINAIQGNLAIETLNFSRCQLGPEDISAIATSLNKLRIKKLSLANNLLTNNKDILLLLETLETNTTIEKLDLSDNNFDGIFGRLFRKQLIQFLKKNRSIKYLDLAGNFGIGKEGHLLLEILIEILENNDRLISLSLKNIPFDLSLPISPILLYIFYKELKKNFFLRQLCLDESLPNDIKKEIDVIIERNRQVSSLLAQFAPILYSVARDTSPLLYSVDLNTPPTFRSLGPDILKMILQMVIPIEFSPEVALLIKQFIKHSTQQAFTEYKERIAATSRTSPNKSKEIEDEIEFPLNKKRKIDPSQIPTTLAEKKGLTFDDSRTTELEFIKKSNYFLGLTADDGGCFFGALEQSYNDLNPTAEPQTEKTLRMQCHAYYVDEQHPEQKEKIDCWNKKEWDGLEQDKEDYYFIQYTQPELDNLPALNRNAIWGRPAIEGVILCHQLKLPAIYVLEIPEDSTMPPGFIKITAEKSTSIEQTEWENALRSRQFPFLAVSRNHFVPLLPQHSPEKDQAVTQPLNVTVNGLMTFFYSRQNNPPANPLNNKEKEEVIAPSIALPTPMDLRR